MHFLSNVSQKEQKVTDLTSSILFIYFFSFLKPSQRREWFRVVGLFFFFLLLSRSKLIGIWFVHCALYLGTQGKFQPVDQVVMDEEFPACTRLLRCSRSLASLHHIAEEKGNNHLKKKKKKVFQRVVNECFCVQRSDT